MMRQLLSIKKILAISLFSSIVYAEKVGDITEQSGNGAISRQTQEFVAEVGSGVEFMDSLMTGNGRMAVEFLDASQIRITENSTVVIDQFVYDANPDNSKMALSFAKGTARFISGSIGKMKKENIKLKTNTATIGIRGTDFTVTVDELDRTLVILLPDKNGESSGEITVTNEGGTVTLNQAFQATIVSTISSPPASPVQIENITVAQIDNLFIVSPPEEIQQVQEEARTENSSNNILTADFLEFNELEKDYLEEEKDWSFSELDINLLDVDFLQDLLLIIEESDLLSRKSSEGFDGIMIEGTQPGLDPDTQYNTIIEDTGFIWFYRQVNGIISIRIPIDSNAYINTVTDQKESIITVGDGTSAMITITQVQ